LKIINCIILVLTILAVSVPNLAVSRDDLYTPKYRILGTSSKADIRKAIVEEYGERMAKIAECESGLNLYKHNLKDPHGGSYGLFQINAPWIPVAKKMGLDIMQPNDNFKFAKVILKAQGEKAWSCSKLV